MVFPSRAAFGAAVLLLAFANAHPPKLAVRDTTEEVTIVPETLDLLSKDGETAVQCVKKANPDKVGAGLKVGDTIIVPLECCETRIGTGTAILSCAEPICALLDECAGLKGLVERSPTINSIIAKRQDTTNPPENPPPENTPPENTPPENTPPENTPPENTPPENTPPENTPPENTPPENTPPENTPPENTPPENTPPETTKEVVIGPGTIDQISTGGGLDLQCVQDANPDKTDFKAGDTIRVPLVCCKIGDVFSCNEPFCSNRNACAPQPLPDPEPIEPTTILGKVEDSGIPVGLPLPPPPSNTDLPPAPPPPENTPPETTKEVVIGPGTIDQISTGGGLDLQCVQDANPDKTDFKAGDTIHVPLACCKIGDVFSCNEPFCSNRNACAPQPLPDPAPIEPTTILGKVEDSGIPVGLPLPPPPSNTDPPPAPPPPGNTDPPPAPPPPGNTDPPPAPPPPGNTDPPPAPPPPGNTDPPPAPPPPGNTDPPPVPPPPGNTDPPPAPPPPGNTDPPPPPPPPPNTNPPPPASPTDPPCTPATRVRRAGDPPLCPVPDPPPTPPDTDPSDEEDPEGSGKPYLISGKKGVGETEFKALTILPPLDKKQGDIISFPDSPWVSFQVLDLSEKDAALLRLNPLIEFVVEITEDEGEQRAVPRRDTSLLKRVTSWVKRALPSALSVRLNAGYHLKLLSARNQRLNPTVLPDYTFQPSLGEGQTIYVLDSGYQTLHEEFADSGGRVRDHTVPNVFTLDPLPGVKEQPDNEKAPQDNTDYTGHGTKVASVAAGKYHGVASKANLVVVKIKNAAINPGNPGSGFKGRGVTDSAIDYAFQYVIDDVARQRKDNPNMKFVVNLSYGFKKVDSTHPRKHDVLKKAIETCWEKDIVVVVCATNEGQHAFLDEFAPQDLGTADNALITVGGVGADGKYYTDTANSRGSGMLNVGGNLDLFAGAIDVTVAKHDGGFDDTVQDSGTSLATPAVAGLAAYFFSIPELQDNWHEGTVAMDILKFMRKNAEVRNDEPITPGINFPKSPAPNKDAIIVPYNLALNDLCDIQAAAKKRSSLLHSRAPKEERPVVVDGAVSDPDLKTALCATTNGPANPPAAPGGDDPAPTGGESQPQPTQDPGPPPAEPPADPPAPPPPAPPTRAYTVGAFEGVWAILEFDRGKTSNDCGDGVSVLAKGDQVPDRLLNGLTASLPSPVTLEPFNLADSYNDCKFTTEGNQDGSIECKDQDPIGCTAQQLDGEILTCVVTFWNCNF